MASHPLQKHPVIFLVEPDLGQRDTLISLLQRTGFAVQGFGTAEELLDVQGFPERAGCVVSELNLPGLDGLALLRRLREAHPTLPFIMLTGDADIGLAVAALHSKVSDYVIKPVVERDLVQRIRVVLRDAGKAKRVSKKS